MQTVRGRFQFRICRTVRPNAFTASNENYFESIPSIPRSGVFDEMTNLIIRYFSVPLSGKVIKSDSFVGVVGVRSSNVPFVLSL